VLVGAGMVLLSFFLPWFSSNAGQEMGRLGGQMMDGLLQHMQTPTLYIAGGEVGNGLGWIVLLLALGVAVLPLKTPPQATAQA
jgi:hypothetical protein